METFFFQDYDIVKKHLFKYKSIATSLWKFFFYWIAGQFNASLLNKRKR